MLQLIVSHLFIFLLGIIFGSFLNVCIIRLPIKETIVTKPSHCMQCGYRLKWYDLVPLVSWILLKGRCRKCGKPISKQYPIIEAVNGIAWVLIFIIRGIQYDLAYDGTSVCYCALFSALLVLSIIDFRTLEIPLGCNIFILAVGLIHLCVDYSNWLQYVIGLTAVSLFLYIIYVGTGGRGIGGGDIKLMAACGLLLGWKLNILGFILGCILGSVIHIIRMKVSKQDHVLAMGPYLSIGVMIAALWGDRIINWYLEMM
ncbi:MAG: prepilin peptidase [Lachnospiraceae bacterium]|nr:prepilin peptidase [Lachnospiraceae bacterium]